MGSKLECHCGSYFRINQFEGNPIFIIFKENTVEKMLVEIKNGSNGDELDIFLNNGIMAYQCDSCKRLWIDVDQGKTELSSYVKEREEDSQLNYD